MADDVKVDGVHISEEEAREARDPSIGTGTPETAPFEEPTVEGGEVELLDDVAVDNAEARGKADDDDAVDVPEAGDVPEDV